MAAPSARDQQRVAAERCSDTEHGLDRLRADASGRLRVHRATDGAVDFVSSTNGRAMLDGDDDATPRRSAQDRLARYGAAFGVDGGLSRAVVRETLDSSTGGSVVRAEQVVDGVAVFGGQVVMSLDEDQGLVSVGSATTEVTEVPAALVSETKARRSALVLTAKAHRVGTDELIVTGKGRRLYDPAIVHTSDPLGVRPVWEFEVVNGSDIRERVLVGTDRREIALHFNDAPRVNRVTCDNASDNNSGGTQRRPHRQRRGRQRPGPGRRGRQGGHLPDGHDRQRPVQGAQAQARFTVTGKVVKRGTTSGVTGMPVTLQRRLTTAPTWTNVATGTVDWRGLKSWAVRQLKPTYYRVVSRGVRTYFWSVSAARLVRRR